MNRAQKIVRIGSIGEMLVKSALLNAGHQVALSENRFDSVKDMTINNDTTVEVKTLVSIKKYNAFALGSSQWRKCDEVDHLFFVEIPSKEDDPITIWESKKPRTFFTQYFNGDTCRMYTKDDLHIYENVYNKAISKELCELSPSKYR